MKQVATVQERLNEALAIRKMKPIELSNISNISKSNISHYMHGTTVPNVRRLAALANALLVNELWLAGFDVPMDKHAFDNPGSVKADIIRMLDDMDANQLEKTANFIVDYIL